jgi:hypothetical protein
MRGVNEFAVRLKADTAAVESIERFLPVRWVVLAVG